MAFTASLVFHTALAMPEDKTVTVYHRNAKRLEDDGQAAPCNVVLRLWTVGDQRIAGPATIDVARRL